MALPWPAREAVPAFFHVPGGQALQDACTGAPAQLGTSNNVTGSRQRGSLQEDVVLVVVAEGDAAGGALAAALPEPLHHALLAEHVPALGDHAAPRPGVAHWASHKRLQALVLLLQRVRTSLGHVAVP